MRVNEVDLGQLAGVAKTNKVYLYEVDAWVGAVSRAILELLDRTSDGKLEPHVPYLDAD